MHPIIKVTNLSKHFREFKAVDNLSFTVNEGDIYGFLGQNGAGKSTTIRMLLTLIEPSQGEIEMFGMNLFTHRKEILKQTGAVIEKPDVYKYLSAYENLQLFSKISGGNVLTKAQLLDRLETVGLKDRAFSKVKTFSQGMKQRLGIAVALVHDPELIILDEPSNGLDPQGIADMRNMILQLKELGKTILISSHLLSEIELVANRMIIIHKGKKVIEGNVNELLDPSDTIVKVETTDDSTARTIISQLDFISLLPDSNSIRIKMNKKDVPAIVQEISQAGLGIISVQSRHSLEDYFISLTNPELNVEPVLY